MNNTEIRIRPVQIIGALGLLAVLIGFVVGKFSFTGVIVAILLIGVAVAIRDAWRVFWSS